MSNNTEPLDASVTLEEIFAVVAQKRAPLAPELAGYLVLELAEGAGSAGEIDSRYVYVSEEGSVALVRGPHEESGDAEASLRRLLAKLLETAGAQTPALASVAKRKGGAGVAVLVEELEASLIPVNRSAGKRALARLARETKRVTNRVGRNASAPSIDPPQVRRELASVDLKFADEEVPTTNRRDVPAEVMQAAIPSIEPPAPKPAAPPASPDESQSDLPTVGISKEDLEAAQTRTKRDSVDSLLDSFEISGQREDRAVAKDLKRMAGLEPTKTPPPAQQKPEPEPEPSRPSRLSTDDALESLLAESPAAPSLRKDTGKESPAARRSSSNPPQRARHASFAEDRQLPTAPSQVKKVQISLTTEAMLLGKKKRGSGVGIILLLALILAGFAIALWLVKPGFLTGRTPEKIAAERAAAEAESARIAAKNAIPACHATLMVANAPKDSEILIREGQAPVDVEHMPVGARLEFVATAEGYAPRRAIVNADDKWDMSTGKARLDLPIQLDKSKAKAGAVDPWPLGEAGSEAGSQKANPGTIHVSASPKGAEIWLVAGIGPEVKRGEAPEQVAIEEIVSCDTDVDVLVAGPPGPGPGSTFRKHLHVAASSFVADPAAPAGKANVRVAHLNVK